jgi:hypothetical protein
METGVVTEAPANITPLGGGNEGCEKERGHESPIFDFELRPLEGLL